MSDKFFKLKIQKLLDRLPTPIKFNEAQWAMVYGLDENRFFVQIAARRTGKSYAAAILAFAKLLEPGQQVMVVAPNFSLSSIIWDYVTDLIKNLEIRGWALLRTPQAPSNFRFFHFLDPKIEF